MAHPKTLGKIVSAQHAAASGCLFFWILFFGQAKTKSAGTILNSFSWPEGRNPGMGFVAVSRLSVREPTPLKRRDSDTKPF
ncbi:MAG: hypothetical protein Q8K07_02670, partial [Methylicorpusculum sp.]|uniref:hypothetical protein n=1 Tax=Methylicorpusculum sp. TaxID=2713644 RepID=UPI0027308FD4